MNTHLVPRLPRLARSLPRAAQARIHTTRPRAAPRIVPHVGACPEPSCACEPPPPGLDIDRKSRLRGVFVPYKEQVLVCSGRDDWVSKVEEEESAAGDLVRGLKGGFGRGGRFSDPYHNASILTASFPSPGQDPAVYLLPSFKYFPSLSPDPSSVTSFTKAHLLPTKLHPMHDGLLPEDKARLTRDPSQAEQHPATPVKDIVVLICGHGGRDVRCGVMGPLLRDKFRSVFGSEGTAVTDAPPTEGGDVGARVGLISHVGGHKFAGNVIVYVPPTMTLPDGSAHRLAGCAVWYGRVEPRHVEGIVGATVREGRVIGELFRGGIDAQGALLDIKE